MGRGREEKKMRKGEDEKVRRGEERISAKTCQSLPDLAEFG